MRKSKFDELGRDELLRRVLELEDENQRLRPPAAKFKLGQLVAMPTPKHQYMPGQRAIFFTVLKVEWRYDTWHYAWARSGTQTFSTYPENKLRALTPTELDGTPDTGDVAVPTEASTLAATAFPDLPGQNGPVQAGIAHDVVYTNPAGHTWNVPAVVPFPEEF